MSTVAEPASLDALLSMSAVTEWDGGLVGGDPLGFADYGADRFARPEEAVRTGEALVGGVRCAFISSDFAVYGGSMGIVVGEKVSRAFTRAAHEGIPVVASVRTGGARMQEGMLSLIQMPRVVSAWRRHSAAGLLSLGSLRSPTAGGVFASWASLVDLRAAEKGATIGFAGPRVVEEMTGVAPPPTSHTAESAYRAGLVDAVLAEECIGSWVLAALGASQTPLELSPSRPTLLGLAPPPGEVGLTRRARWAGRASGLEWAAALCDSWVEIKGVDPAFRAALASIDGVRCVVVAMDRHVVGDCKGRPGPEAFRLAQRAIRLADKLRLPVLTLVDTPGAEPAPDSEAGGIAREIARTLLALDELATPSVSVCVGEGGSGGAIALAHTDRLFVLEDSIFSVIGPEAAAVILWRDSARAAEAAAALRIDSASLVGLGVSDGVLPEPRSLAAVDRVRSTVAEALVHARPGERRTRVDAASERWLSSR
ncbi:carboxyl transferase domain-containing protein [Rhodococcus koreensis]